jgi:hypothetical protein
MRSLTRLLIPLLLMSSSAAAWDIAGGIAGVEEGDDRYRPAAALHLGFTDYLYLRNYMYGRSIGPYTERTTVTSLNYRFAPIASANVRAGIGATTLVEQSIYNSDNSEEESESKSQFNFGGSFGLAYVMPWQRVHLSFNWDAHIYPAGSSAILLATGRKHMIGITTGFKF